MLKIGIWGIYPPPSGGVSIHVKRLLESLQNDLEIKCKIYNISKQKNSQYRNIKNMKLYLFKYIFIGDEDIIHCHERQWLNLFLLIVICKLKKSKFILTFHSFRENPRSFSKIKFFVFKYVIDNCDRIICVNNDINQKICKYTINKKIEVIPAYINPKVQELKNPMIEKAIKDKNTVIVANASRLVFYNNEDLYGTDLLIELCHRVNQKYKKIVFIFCVPIIIEKEYYNELINKIAQYELTDSFIIINDEVNFPSLINRANIFIRPTNTDGDSISVREAIYLNKPTIASDVIERPKGCITFKNRDIDDLEEKLVFAIENYSKIAMELSKYEKVDTVSSIVKIYNEVYKGEI